MRVVLHRSLSRFSIPFLGLWLNLIFLC